MKRTTTLGKNDREVQRLILEGATPPVQGEEGTTNRQVNSGEFSARKRKLEDF